jgi:cytochrome P450
MRAVLGVEDPERRARLAGPLRRQLDMIASRRQVLMLALMNGRTGPRSPWTRLAAARRDADALIYDEIRRRRADPEDRDDIFSLLLAARDENGERLSDHELRDELMTLLMAGHETTATALAWTLERVVRHPEVLARLRAEPDGDYLDAVIKETLRLRPVVPAVARALQVPMEFGGWRLPAGVHIAPSIYLLHRRPDIYPQPTTFRPERFLDKPPGTYEWIPFGGGTRRCLGASFALFEMNTVLATVLRDVTLQPARGLGEGVVRRAITFAPARGGRIAVQAA